MTALELLDKHTTGIDNAAQEKPNQTYLSQLTRVLFLSELRSCVKVEVAVLGSRP